MRHNALVPSCISQPHCWPLAFTDYRNGSQQSYRFRRAVSRYAAHLSAHPFHPWPKQEKESVRGQAASKPVPLLDDSKCSGSVNYSYRAGAPMPTREEIETAFRAYYDEIHNCLRHRCYWALLHLLIVLPDICGALESKNGEANGPRYKEWCKRYLADLTLSDEEWWDIHCVVLHQGRTLARRGRYIAYSFSQPNAQGVAAHRITVNRPSGLELNLDVAMMTEEIQASMHAWFNDIEANKNPSRSHNVARNLPSLACVPQRGQESISPLINGLIVRQSTASPS